MGRPGGMVVGSRETYGSGVLERPETLKPVDHAHRSRPSEVCNISPYRKGIIFLGGGGGKADFLIRVIQDANDLEKGRRPPMT